MRTYLYELIYTTGVNTTVSSSGHKIDYTVSYAMQAIYEGGLNGVLQLQSSNDGLNFDTIQNSPTLTQPVLTGTTGSFTWNVLSANYLYVRSQFVPSSASSGNLKFLINSKGF